MCDLNVLLTKGNSYYLCTKVEKILSFNKQYLAYVEISCTSRIHLGQLEMHPPHFVYLLPTNPPTFCPFE